MKITRRTFLELSSGFLVCGCSSVATSGTSDFPVVVLSDIHFQPFISPFNGTTVAANAALVAKLDAADASQWAAIFQGLANNTPSAPGTDTNYSLLVLALASIKQNLGASPLVLFTGDFLGHGVAQYYAGYSQNNNPAAAAAFVDKTLQFILQQIRAAVGTLPVVFALGNCDSYTGYGPDTTFLSNTVELLYMTLPSEHVSLNRLGFEEKIIILVVVIVAVGMWKSALSISKVCGKGGKQHYRFPGFP